MSRPTTEQANTPNVSDFQLEGQGGIPAFLRWAEYLLVAVVIAGILDTLRFAADYIPLPFTVNFEEGNQLLAALEIAHGHSPYPPITRPPYIINPYGPVFYSVDGAVVKLFGPSLTAPRLLVLVSGLVVSLLVVLLLKRWTRSWVVALGFGLSFLAVPLVRDWLHVLRVDIFGLALAMAGLYIFASTESLAWPALFFILALNTKITLLAAPVSCILFLMLARDWRRARRLIGWLLLFGVAGLAAVGLSTHGWGLYQMFYTHPDQYRVSWYLSRLRPFALLNTALIAGVIVLGVRDYRRREYSLPFIYAVLATIMTFTIGQWANDANHLIEWQAALSLGAGCGYQSLRIRRGVDLTAGLIPVGIILLVALGLPERLQISPELDACPAAYSFAKAQPGQLLTESPGVATLSGKTVWMNNSFEYAIMGKAGRLDQTPLAEMVRQKFFGLILIGNDPASLQEQAVHPEWPDSIWPAGFVKALLDNYHPVAGFSCVDANVAYEPDSEPAPSAAR